MQVIRVEDTIDPELGAAAAVVTASKDHDEWHFFATVGRDLPPREVERFIIWADELSHRLVDFGPAVDGWVPCSDGRWRWPARHLDRTA